MFFSIAKSRVSARFGLTQPTTIFPPRAERAIHRLEISGGDSPRPDVGRSLVRSGALSNLAILLLSTILAWAGPGHAGGMLEGRVTHVRDVDTIVVNDTAVRLNGVDGPETSTAAGREARDFMVRLVNGKRVACELNGQRTYDRWVGVCYLDGEDIGAIAVGTGHALDCRRYSGGKYGHLETLEGKSRIRRAGYCR